MYYSDTFNLFTEPPNSWATEYDAYSYQTHNKEPALQEILLAIFVDYPEEVAEARHSGKY